MHASLLLLAASLCCNPLAADAQALLASNTPPAPERYAAAEAPTVVVAGLITSPDGPLPGAVVTLTATRQMAVTNSEGEFQFMVRAGSRVLKAVVSYAGYADEDLSLNVEDAEPTATLSDVQAIAMPRRQQLKFYLRTARKETHRKLRQLHKNTR
ncbi:MAG: carboxypeptidase-like regulatory domain-containing protein [Bacteroidota bacterium]|nr:carboxypeptidase-like regulatory domain-containing protein [Bacteroidota bacterium]